MGELFYSERIIFSCSTYYIIVITCHLSIVTSSCFISVTLHVNSVGYIHLPTV